MSAAVVQQLTLLLYTFRNKGGGCMLKPHIDRIHGYMIIWMRLTGLSCFLQEKPFVKGTTTFILPEVLIWWEKENKWPLS